MDTLQTWWIGRAVGDVCAYNRALSMAKIDGATLSSCMSFATCEIALWRSERAEYFVNELAASSR